MPNQEQPWQWTKPHHGVQHYPAGPFRASPHWVTVEDYEGSATLLCWFPGCQFSPLTYNFDSVETAKAEGERYVKSQGALAPREHRASTKSA